MGDKIAPEETLLKFPCQITVKAMGYADPEFESLVVELIRQHAPEITAEAISSRTSRAGKYFSVSVKVQAQSRAQMDAIYHTLSAHPKVLMAL